MVDLNAATGIVATLIQYGIYSILGFVILIILGLIGYFSWKRKKWNLRVEVKIPRSDGRLINSEKAKGHYSASEGVVYVKRKGIPTIGMKPFDVREYLQGENYLEVMQIGAEEFIPLKPTSYTTLKVFDSRANNYKDVGIMQIEADVGKRKNWKLYFERTAKKRFTLKGFMDEYGKYLALGLIVFIIFLGFSILWIRMPSICG